MTPIRNLLLASSLVLAAGVADAADGKKVFRKACAACHSVKSEKIRAQIPPGHDLGGVGGRMDAEALRAVVLGEETEVKRHKPFKGSDEELQALIDWLLALK